MEIVLTSSSTNNASTTLWFNGILSINLNTMLGKNLMQSSRKDFLWFFRICLQLHDSFIDIFVGTRNNINLPGINQIFLSFGSSFNNLVVVSTSAITSCLINLKYKTSSNFHTQIASLVLWGMRSSEIWFN